MNKYYLFPFEKITQGSSIIIYGAGKIGKDYVEQILISKYCHIIYLVDKNYKKYVEIKNIPVYGIDKIFSEKENINILIASEEYGEEIKKSLIGLGIEGNRIITAFDRKIDITTMYSLRNIVNCSELHHVFEDYINNANSKIQYLMPIIEGIYNMDYILKKEFVEKCKEYLRNEKVFPYKVILFRILYEGKLFDKELFKMLAENIINEKGYELERFWIIQDMSTIICKHKEYQYDQYYVQIRECIKKICKNMYNNTARSKTLILRKKVKKICILSLALSKKTNTFLIAVSNIVNNLYKYCDREIEIKIFCEDLLYYTPGQAIIEPLANGKTNSESFSLIHKEVIDSRANIYYNKGFSIEERMNNIINAVFDYDPDIIIDCCANRVGATSILYEYYPIIHRPFDDEKDCGIFHKYLAGIRYQDCISENRIYKTMNDKDILNWNFPLPVFWENNKVFSREKYGIKDSEFVIVTVGTRLDVELDNDFINYVSDFMNENHDVVWIVIGKKKNDYLISKNKIQDKRRIICIDYEDNLIDLYKICNVYLNPKRKGGGFSIQMAMQVGLPIATLNQLCDIYRIVGEKNLINGDYKELLEYIKKLKEDKLFYLKMKEDMLRRFWSRTDNIKVLMNDILLKIDVISNEFWNKE